MTEIEPISIYFTCGCRSQYCEYPDGKMWVVPYKWCKEHEYLKEKVKEKIKSM